ncbi:hypothetical protein FGL97_01270 [Pseudomonas putida]|uniref:hypothetical protein n=1 Tax=Pseudomonas putida TaxID=303 RepID=UPI00159E7D7F|nr:hypothetical protein [Pseudomonas putida]NVN61881.1 hypothetical protein [Pseudomonas putida]NVN66874.1 hypothetical protein [Pseudomonas putida]
MSYALRNNAFACLRAQTNLTGCFTQILHDDSAGSSVKAELQTEVYLDQLTVAIRMGSTVNTLTLPANSLSSARKIAVHLEAIANGQVDTAAMSSTDQLLAGAA